jgi:hypothetical protein
MRGLEFNVVRKKRSAQSRPRNVDPKLSTFSTHERMDDLNE